MFRLVFVLSASIAALIGCAPAPSPVSHPDSEPPTALSHTDSLLLRVAEHAADAGEEITTIWPGFWPSNQPFALWPFREGALLVSQERPGSQRVERIEVGGVLQDIAYYWPDPSRREHVASFDTEYPVGRLLVPGVGLLPTTLELPRELGQLFFLFHEAFHGYQQRTFFGRDSLEWGEEPFVEPTMVSDPTFRARMAIERRILADALTAPDDSVRGLARDYLAVRALRFAEAPAIAATEQLVERKEASAEWVGWRAATIAFGGNVRVTDILRANLLDGRFEEAVRVSDRYRTQLYATGAAVGHLLDRLDVDWQVAMERGASFPELFAAATGSAWPDPSTANGVLVRRNYETIRRELVQQNVDAIASSEIVGPRIVIRGLLVTEQRYSGTDFRPEPGTIVYDTGSSLEVVAQGARFQTRGLRVVEARTARAAHYTISVSQLPLINGEPATEGTRRHESLQVDGGTVTIVVDRQARVTRMGDVLTIELE